MHKIHSTISWGLFLILNLIVSVGADELKIDKIICKPKIAYHCTLKTCTKIDIVDIYTSKYIEINLKNNTLTGSIDDYIADIEYNFKNDNGSKSMIIYGSHHRESSSYDWVLNIDINNRKMTIASINSQASNTVFGECDWNINK